MLKPSRLCSYLGVIIVVLCSVCSVSRAESLEESSVNASLEPILHSWMEAIAEATLQGGQWLSQGRVLRLGAFSQSTQTLPALSCLNGLGATLAAVTSFPLLNWISIGASGGFHHPASASGGAAQGFVGFGSSGRMFGAGLRARLTEDFDATLRFERLADAGSTQGTIDAKAVVVGIGFRF